MPLGISVRYLLVFLLRDVEALTCVSGVSYTSLEILKVVDV